MNRTSAAPWLRWLLIIVGSVSVGLGVIGIFIPLLPTTPFLLLAATCYAKSSDRFYNWLISNRWLGKYIRNYREGKGTPLRVKAVSIFIMWAAIGYSAIYATESLALRVVLTVIAVGVTTHLLRIPTSRE